MNLTTCSGFKSYRVVNYDSFGDFIIEMCLNVKGGFEIGLLVLSIQSRTSTEESCNEVFDFALNLTQKYLLRSDFVQVPREWPENCEECYGTYWRNKRKRIESCKTTAVKKVQINNIFVMAMTCGILFTIIIVIVIVSKSIILF